MKNDGMSYFPQVQNADYVDCRAAIGAHVFVLRLTMCMRERF